MCYIHTVEYYLATRRNELVIHATTWMNHENMVSERSQLLRTTNSMIPFTQNVRIGKYIEAKSRLVVA